MTTPAPVERARVGDDQIAEIVHEVWRSFLGESLVGPVDGDEPFTADHVTGCVAISGAWAGSVIVEATTLLGSNAAATMFMLEPAEIGADELADAFGELTNMIGGNIKSMLPGPCTLSTPAVASGDSYRLRVPGATCINRLGFRWQSEPVVVSIWQQ